MLPDSFSLFLSFLRNNWKSVLISAIGFTLALTAILQTTIIVDSYRSSLMEDFFLSTPFDEYSDFKVNMEKIYLSRDIDRIPSEVPLTVNNFRGLGQRAAEKLGVDNLLEHEVWHLYIGGLIHFNNSNLFVSHPRYTIIDTMDEETLTACQSFLVSGRLPLETNEAVLLAEKEFILDHSYHIGGKITISSFNTSSAPKDVTISGIFEYPGSDQNETLPREGITFWDYFDWSYRGPVLLTNLDNFIHFSTTVFKDVFSLPLRIFGQIHIDPTQLDAFNLVEERLRLEQLQEQIGLECSTLGYVGFDVGETIISKIDLFESHVSGTITLMWLFSLPILTTTLFLATFSFGLLKQKKRLQIGILKTRGASVRQIILILLGESVITMFLGIGAGILASLPLARFTLQSVGFLDFSGEAPSLTFSLSYLPPVFVFGTLFAILLNLFPILQLTKQQVNESILPKNQDFPFWQKYYLDVIVFSIGLLGVISLFFLQKLLRSNIIPGQASRFIYILTQFISSFFGIPSPILITVGGAMLITRFLPIIVTALARWSWRFEGGIIAFGFRNLSHRIPSVIRATALICIVIAFSIALLSIPYNNDKNTMDTTYYNYLGADMIITPSVEGYNQTSYNKTLFNLPLTFIPGRFKGVLSISPIIKAYAQTIAGDQVNILGVDINTYLQTAFFREDFLNQDVLSCLSRFDVTTALESLLQGDLFPDTPNLDILLSMLQSNKTIILHE
ncbi:MAG: FtsX-like permease family protein, partial [Candidatus Hodarchaeota archaeon]